MNTEFSIDEERLPALLARVVEEYGAGLEDFDDEALVHAGLELLVELAADDRVIVAPDGSHAADIDVTPLAGYGSYALVRLVLDQRGLHISGWAIEVDDTPSAFGGPDALSNLRACLEDVVLEANRLLRTLRQLRASPSPD